MLTNEKILAVFESYLAEDDAYELVTTRRGYAVINWENAQSTRGNICRLATPEELRDKLLSLYREYNAFTMLPHNDETERALTAEENRRLTEMVESMRAKCN